MTTRMFSGNFTRHIVQSLGKSIALGEFPPGSPLKPEADLCETFDASRTVLREAVKMLTAKGMLNARPRRGTIVLPESHWNLSDPDILNWLLDRKGASSIIPEFAEVRLAIEPAAARLAAINITEEQRSNLKAAMERMKAAELGQDDPFDADIAFHIGILEASNNRFFWNMRHTIEVALKFSIRLTNRLKGIERALVENHEEILTFILNGDAENAENKMRALILDAKALLNDATSEDEPPG